MRCGEIAVLGLTSHPRYRGRNAWREASVQMVKDRLDKHFNFWAAELITRALGVQRADGSWDGTVISTCHHVDRVMRLGATARDGRLQKAARWLLQHCIDDVRRQSPAMGGGIVAHNMFSGDDRASEFGSAMQLRPEWDPKSACFRHLPNIQNGLAIRTLVALGHANDKRVIQACENLVELKRAFGGFCDTNIRKGLAVRRARTRKR